MVVNHPPLAAFAAENVGYPKISLSFVFPKQNIHVLRGCLVSKILANGNALITRSSKSWLNSPTMHGSRPSRLGSHQEGALRKRLDCVTTHPPSVSNRRLRCCLTLRRIYPMRCEYRFLDSYLFLSSLHLRKFRCRLTIALWCKRISLSTNSFFETIMSSGL
jgi:hypothetical protein